MEENSIFTDIFLDGEDEDTEAIPVRKQTESVDLDLSSVLSQTSRPREEQNTPQNLVKEEPMRSKTAAKNNKNGNLSGKTSKVDTLRTLMKEKFQKDLRNNFEPIQDSNDYSSYYNSNPTRNARAQEFFKDLKRYANTEAEKATFASFNNYESQPIYSDMTEDQKRYYLYWRDQFRKGNYIPSDLGYLKILAYEIINGIGWEDPKEGFEMLRTLLDHYEADFPELSNLLGNFLIDFCYAQDELALLNEVESNFEPRTDLYVDTLLTNHLEDKPLSLPLHVLQFLSDFDFSSSKLNTDQQYGILEEAFPKVISLIDAKTRKDNGGKGLLEVYGPSYKRSFDKTLYNNSIYPTNKRTMSLDLMPYTNSYTLRDVITGSLRQAENGLRQIYKHRGRLKVDRIDEDLKKLIDAYINRRYNPDYKPTAPAKPAKKDKLELNFKNIDTIRKQSDNVRDILEVKQQEDKEISVQGLTALLKGLSKESKKLVSALERSLLWKTPYNRDNQPQIQEINKQALELFDQEMLEIMDDNLMVNPNFIKTLNYIFDYAKDSIDFNVIEEEKKSVAVNAEIPEDLKDFLEDLTDRQTRVLKAILFEPNPNEEIKNIAQEAFTLPDMLIDDINGEAMDFLDDIIIENYDDVPVILDEYRHDLEQALKDE